MVLVLGLIHKGDFRAIFSYCNEFRESDWSAIYRTGVSKTPPLTLKVFHDMHLNGNGYIKVAKSLEKSHVLTDLYSVLF